MVVSYGHCPQQSTISSTLNKPGLVRRRQMRGAARLPACHSLGILLNLGHQLWLMAFLSCLSVYVLLCCFWTERLLREIIAAGACGQQFLSLCVRAWMGWRVEVKGVQLPKSHRVRVCWHRVRSSSCERQSSGDRVHCRKWKMGLELLRRPLVV